MKLTTPFIKEGAKMKKTILAILFVAMFIASSMLVLPAHSTVDVPTVAFLNIVPNPAGLDQTVLITGAVTPPPPYGTFMLELSCSNQITGELLWSFTGPSNEYGQLYYEFDASSLGPGSYVLVLNFGGQYFDEYLDQYYLPCTAQMTLTVTSDEVPVGSDVVVFPDPKVGLVFERVTEAGFVYVDKSDIGPPPDEGSLIGPYYYVTTTAVFEGGLTVRIFYDDNGLTPGKGEALCLIQTDIVRGDVNLDGRVNWGDLIAIYRAFRSYPGHCRWNPSCDLNKDNKVNERDLWIALKNFGKKSQWTDITISVDTENNIITGRTDHLDELDPFGVR